MVNITVSQREVPAIKVCSVLPCEREDTALMLDGVPPLRACPDHIADFWTWTGKGIHNTHPLKPLTAGTDVLNFEVVFEMLNNAPRYRCDCPSCPCHVPIEKRARMCPECYRGNCMDWTGKRKLPEVS